MNSIGKENGKKHDFIILIVLSLLCNLYKIIFSAVFSNPGLQTPQDLFSILYSAAYFAGKDWMEIGHEYSAYYGYGFVALFSWLYRITNDGLLVYRIILVICNLLNVVSCVFCYKIAEMFQGFSNKYVLYFICIASTAVQGTGWCGIYNEYALNVCVWAVLYLLVKLCDANMLKNVRIKYTVILGVLLAYSCTVHARAVALYILVAFCVIVFWIKEKKIIVHISTMIGMCLLYVVQKYYTDYLQMILLGEVSSNSSVIAKAANGMQGGFSWKMIQTFLISVLTYIHELNFITAGVAVACVAAMLYAGCCCVKNKVVINFNNRQRNILLCCFVYSICGIGAFLLGICFTNRTEIYRGMVNDISVHLRFLTLVRYFMPFVAPFIFCTIIFLKIFKEEARKDIFRWALVIFIGLQVIFFLIVFPEIKATGWANVVYLPYTWDIEMERDAVYLVSGGLVFFFVALFCIWQIRKGNWKILCMTIFLFSTLGVIYRYVHQMTLSNNYNLVNGGYEYFKEVDETEDIYVVETIAEGEEDETAYYFLYQILLPNMCIIPGVPTDVLDETKILTNDPTSVFGYESYEVIQLDDNEWLLVRNEAVD